MNETHPTIEQIIDFLHGEVAAADEAAISAHLSLCPDCQRLQAEETAITQALRAYARAAEREIPPAVAARVRAAVAGPPSLPLRERLGAFVRPALVLPVAAAAIIVFYLSSNGRHRPAPAIDAAYYVNEHAALAARAPFSDGVLPATLTADDEAR